MPLKRYGVLRGAVVGAHREWDDERPHYQIHVRVHPVDFRVAVNVQHGRPRSELLYLVDDDFRHPITNALPSFPTGFTRVHPRRNNPRLDYVRGSLLQRRAMRSLPDNVPGPNNDLSDLLASYTQAAMDDPRAEVYAFGERWGPERHPDRFFGFRPGNGVHDIHMNQGNIPAYRDDDGTWEDGGLIFRFPADECWIAIFLAFQSQSWETDERTGHAR